MKRWCLVAIALAAATAQKTAVVPPELPVDSNPDLILRKPDNDPLAARYPWYPQALRLGGRNTVGPLDADWVWPDIALVDWNRDGLLDVIGGLSAGTYSHRPKDQQFRSLLYVNSGKRQAGVPIFGEPTQIDFGFPIGAMVFDDLDGDGAMDMITLGRNAFRWYRDTSQTGSRQFEYVGNVQDFGHQIDLKLLETVSMQPSLQLIDWDGDGRKDLIVGGRGGNLNYYPKKFVGFGKGFAEDGSWVGGDRNGSVVFHKNLGMQNGKPAFSTGQRLTAGDDERTVNFYDTATAVITDWNEDGLSDLIVASFDNLFWYPNTGTKQRPRLGNPQRISVAGLPRLPWERVQLLEANWSASDRHNLILQGSSFAWYLRNTGPKGRPEFKSIQTLLQYNPALSAGDFAIPAVGDLNGDAKPDLMVGNEDGYLLYFENTSPGKQPASFRAAQEVRAGGEIFRIESGRGLQGPAEARWGYTNPVLTDWDNDGDLDVVLGSLLYHLLLLENTGSRKAPVFAAARPLEQDGKPLNVIWRTRPIVHDFDGDGWKDILGVDPGGMLTLYLRTKAGLHAGKRILDGGGNPIEVDGEGRDSGRTKLALMDWDGDGKLDIIAGNAVESFDGLWWYRNTGSGANLALERRPNIPLNMPWNHYIAISPVDWDEDGKIDLIAGSEGGWIWFYRHQ